MECGFTLKSTMPIFFHADNVMAADDLKGWRGDQANRNISVPGDDRSPPWTWQTYLHHDGQHIAIPQECLMAALRAAAANINIPNKGKKTFKALSQSGLLITTDFLEFTNHGKPVPIAPIEDIRNLSFAEQFARVKKMGFELSVKRAAVGTSKHVRVRAMFRAWEAHGTILVNEASITEAILKDMFYIAGRQAGLLDWRPNSKKSPGPFGTFTATLRPVKEVRKAG